jgi:hypothetical protein
MNRVCTREIVLFFHPERDSVCTRMALYVHMNGSKAQKAHCRWWVGIAGISDRGAWLRE